MAMRMMDPSSKPTTDQLVAVDDWSDLRKFRDLPDVDMDRLMDYRIGRLRQQMRSAGVDVHVMVRPGKKP